MLDLRRREAQKSCEKSWIPITNRLRLEALPALHGRQELGLENSVGAPGGGAGAGTGAAGPGLCCFALRLS